MSESKGVEAVERALSILDCFRTDKTELSLAEISKTTGLYKSTILRLGVSLEKYGYVIRSEGSRFRLGPSAWHLGAIYRQGFDLTALLRPELKLLSEATNETASYYVREGNARICLFRSEPVRAIRHSIDEGRSMPLELGASGRVLLAFSDNEEEGQQEVREKGFALSMGERDEEVAAMAVPILTPSGHLLGALNVSGLITRFTPDKHEPILAALKASQQRLMSQISE